MQRFQGLGSYKGDECYLDPLPIGPNPDAPRDQAGILHKDWTGHDADVNPYWILCRNGVSTHFQRAATAEPHSGTDGGPSGARASDFFKRSQKFEYLCEVPNSKIMETHLVYIYFF